MMMADGGNGEDDGSDGDDDTDGGGDDYVDGFYYGDGDRWGRI